MMQMTSSDISATTQVTARIPTPVVRSLDAAAATLRRSRAELVRAAVERYLDDLDDLAVAVERLRDPSDPVLDWEEVRRDLVGSNPA